MYFIFFVAFAIQFANLIGNFIKPTITNTYVEKMELKEIGFPLVLKICVRPGFNETAIKEAGYKHVYNFFRGKSIYNRYIFFLLVFEFYLYPVSYFPLSF